MNYRSIFIGLFTLTLGFSSQMPAMDQTGGKQEVAPSLGQTCAICFEEQPEANFCTLTCTHAFCKTCLNGTLDMVTKAKNTKQLRCPDTTCKKYLEPHDINAITPNATKRTEIATIQFEETMASIKGTKQCPTPDCTHKFIYEDNGQQPNALQCPTCAALYCPKCLIPHMPHITCAQAQKNTQADSKISAEEAATLALIQNTTKECPKCQTKITRSEGCNKIDCTKCGYRFCYRCEELFQVDPKNPQNYLHTCPDGGDHWSTKPFTKTPPLPKIFNTTYLLSIVNAYDNNQYLPLPDQSEFIEFLINNWRNSPAMAIKGLELNSYQLVAWLQRFQQNPQPGDQEQLTTIFKAIRFRFFRNMIEQLKPYKDVPLPDSPHTINKVIDLILSIDNEQTLIHAFHPPYTPIPNTPFYMHQIHAYFNNRLHTYGCAEEEAFVKQTAEDVAAIQAWIRTLDYGNFFESHVHSAGTATLALINKLIKKPALLRAQQQAATLAQQQADRARQEQEKADNRIQIDRFDTAFFISLVNPQIGQQLKLDGNAVRQYLIKKWRTAPNIPIEGLTLKGRQITSHELATTNFLDPAEFQEIYKTTLPYFFEQLREDLSRLGKNDAPLGNSPYTVQHAIARLGKMFGWHFKYNILQPHRDQTIPGSPFKVKDVLTWYNSQLYYYGLNKEPLIQQTAEQHATAATFIRDSAAYAGYMQPLMHSLGDMPVPRTQFTARSYSDEYTKQLTTALAQQQAQAPAQPLAQAPQRETAGGKREREEGEAEGADTARFKQAKNATTTIEKSFVCAYPGCGSAYTTKGNLKRHEQAKHADEAALQKK